MRNLVLLIGCIAASGLGGCQRDIPRPDAPHPRIVSGSPALTKILLSLGLDAHIVGIERHSVAPAGGPVPTFEALKPNHEALAAMAPDLLLVQTSTDEFDALTRLAPDVRVEKFVIENIEQLKAAIARIGSLTGRQDAAAREVARLQAELDAVAAGVAGKPRPSVLFCIDHQRPFVAGGGTFVSDLIALAGGTNAAQRFAKWTSQNAEAIVALQPDVLICQSDESQAQAAREFWLGRSDLPAARTGRVFIVTDPGWTIVSPEVPRTAHELANMLHPAAATQGAQP